MNESVNSFQIKEQECQRQNYPVKQMFEKEMFGKG